MFEKLSAHEKAKYSAAKSATELINSGMFVGLGTGSTAAWFVKCLGEMITNNKLDITAVATSESTKRLAEENGILVKELNEAGWLDITVDGADEFDSNFQLIKGGGGALLREKIVANASHKMIVIADHSKEVPHLGSFPLPVEVVKFGHSVTLQLIGKLIEKLGFEKCKLVVRQDEFGPAETDEGNFILDLHLNKIHDPHLLSYELNKLPGVVENGLFVDTCDTVIIGNEHGVAEKRERLKE